MEDVTMAPHSQSVGPYMKQHAKITEGNRNSVVFLQEHICKALC